LRGDRDLWLNPTYPDFWSTGGEQQTGLARRAARPAALLGVAMLVLTVVVARAEGLEVRDTDGILGGRLAILVGTLLAFFALDLIPRAFVRARRTPGLGPAGAVRAVIADRWSRRRLAIVAAGLLAFYATYFSYRNLKSYLPSVVVQDGDAELLSLERTLFGADPATLLHDLIGTGGAVAHSLSAAYLFFLAFVPISLGAALILSVNPLPGLFWVTALSINWPLGLATYYLLPSLGPVFVEPGAFAALPVTGVTELQQALVAERATGLSSIAAFASLHVSIVFSAALVAHALRVPRALRLALWTFLALTLLSTVYFGWHFVVDDVAGLAIGAASVWLAAAMTGHRAALPALNLPNAITVTRLLVVPVVAAVVLLEPGGSLVAAAAFGLAALSDVADGAVARARGSVTTLGKVLDPLADKVLVLGVLACLAAQERLAVWVVAVIFVREVAVTGLRAVVGRRGVVVSASSLGKLKTAAQIVLVLAVIVAPDPQAAWVQVVVLAAVGLTVASALDYALHLRARQDAPAMSTAS
jgi:CDP-diacylglycerol--glycerol-3-phosphate 3-phosphatidyltransferase